MLQHNCVSFYRRPHQTSHRNNGSYRVQQQDTREADSNILRYHIRTYDFQKLLHEKRTRRRTYYWVLQLHLGSTEKKTYLSVHLTGTIPGNIRCSYPSRIPGSTKESERERDLQDPGIKTEAEVTIRRRPFNGGRSTNVQRMDVADR